MLWLHAVMLFQPYCFPPCQVDDIYRFPQLVWEEKEETVQYSSPRLWRVVSRTRGCKNVDIFKGAEARLEWLALQQAATASDGESWCTWEAALDKQRERIRAWEMLQEAQYRARFWLECDETAIYCLNELRELIGEEAYLAGRMPPLISMDDYREVGK